VTRSSDPGHRFILRRHPWLTAITLVVVAFLVATSVLFVWPSSDSPSRVGAILSLNGENETGRANTAISLAEKGYASTLLFSQGGAVSDTSCPKVPRVKVVCFVANPPHTDGEIKFAANYARAHHLHSIMLVPGRIQVTEARLLMERCFTGRLLVVPAPVPLRGVIPQVIHEWGALVKALFASQPC
jgi:hypothetical protein